MHLLSPLLAIISYIFFEGTAKNKFYTTLFSILLVIIYGTVYLLNVLIFETWVDFYGFNANGLRYVSLVAMIAASYAIGVGIYFLNNLLSLNKEKVD